jgi:predicted ATPase
MFKPLKAPPMSNHAIQQLTLVDFLSYGSELKPFDLHALNVLIGPNGSGKSNLIEAFAVLNATAGDLAATLREGGGIGEYIRKSGGDTSSFMLFAKAALTNPGKGGRKHESLHYYIRVARAGQAPNVEGELIEVRRGTEDAHAHRGNAVYSIIGNGAVIHQRTPGGAGVEIVIEPEDLLRDRSILSQRRDPVAYPEITALADLFGAIVIFREWTFGNRTKLRAPQPTDLPTDFLLPDGSNLALVLHDMLQRSTTRKRLIDYLQRFYAAAQHISTKIQGGTVQLFIEEANDVLVPATRLSDGTLRYLALLAILCHPSPPPIVCIEEPELGLHPDIMPTIAELLLDASQRTQLIVTTHSDALVSALSEVPECVVVCEAGEDGTRLRRLDRDALAEWLNRYSLGEIWRMGEIGGTRW